ncbi:unnamed protein product [Fusarium graminearum]|nr:unnamed protein product [Fusarium graminearum]
MRLSITSQTGRYERETIDDRKDRRYDRRLAGPELASDNSLILGLARLVPECSITYIDWDKYNESLKLHTESKDMPRMGDESSISYKDLGKPTVRPVALPYKLFGESAAIA